MVARANDTCGRGVMAGVTCDSCCYCSPRWLFLNPGMILMAIELVLGARLLISSVHIGDLELGIHTLIYLRGDVKRRLSARQFCSVGQRFCSPGRIRNLYRKIHRTNTGSEPSHTAFQFGLIARKLLLTICFTHQAMPRHKASVQKDSTTFLQARHTNHETSNMVT